MQFRRLMLEFLISRTIGIVESYTTNERTSFISILDTCWYTAGSKGIILNPETNQTEQQVPCQTMGFACKQCYHTAASTGASFSFQKPIKQKNRWPRKRTGLPVNSVTTSGFTRHHCPSNHCHVSVIGRGNGWARLRSLSRERHWPMELEQRPNSP